MHIIQQICKSLKALEPQKHLTLEASGISEEYESLTGTARHFRSDRMHKILQIVRSPTLVKSESLRVSERWESRERF